MIVGGEMARRVEHKVKRKEKLKDDNDGGRSTPAEPFLVHGLSIDGWESEE